MSVSKLISLAFAEAISQNRENQTRWVAASLRIGGRLPQSLLSVQIQKVGKFDTLLRSMEDEFADRQGGGNEDVELFGFDAQSMMSETWVSSAYEFCRTLRQREIAPRSTEFENIFRCLESLRMTIEKLEIAKDRVIKEPLMFMPSDPTPDDRPYAYSKSDRLKSHIMPSGVSARGSLMWCPFDVHANNHVWMERRGLSDGLLAAMEE